MNESENAPPAKAGPDPIAEFPLPVEPAPLRPDESSHIEAPAAVPTETRSEPSGQPVAGQPVAGPPVAGQSIDRPERRPSSARQAPKREERPKHFRAFLAINFPLSVVRRIADEISGLKGPIAATGTRVVWVPPANIHLTLKFLGAIRPEVVEGIRAALARGLRTRAPFEIEARRVGAFPSLEAPKVLWVGLKENPSLQALQKDVEDWMEALGFAREERPFTPHVTIGRVTSVGEQGQGTVGEILTARIDQMYGAGRATEVVIYESRTLGRGAEYRVLGRIPLGFGATAGPG